MNVFEIEIGMILALNKIGNEKDILLNKQSLQVTRKTHEFRAKSQGINEKKKL